MSRPPARPPCRPSCDALEPRRLLAASPPPAGGAFVAERGVVAVEAEHAHAVVAPASGAGAGHAWSPASGAIAAGAVGGALRAGPNVGLKLDGPGAPAGPELRFRVRFDAPGTWRVWLRGNADGGADDSAHVGLGGALAAPGRAVSVSAGPGYRWTNRTMAGGAATVTVPAAGEHVVSVWMREDGLRLDRLVLARDAAYRPTGTGPAESRRAAPPTTSPTVAPVTARRLTFAALAAGPTPGPAPAVAPTTPYGDAPWNVRRLTPAGERAAFSPDGTRLAYIERQFGDAFEIDLRTGVERNLTSAFPNAGFLRVQYLRDGNYVLTGPRTFVDANVSRWNDAGLWVLKADLASPPTWLGQTLFEGVAVAERSDRIAFAVTHRQHPDRFPASQFPGGTGSKLYTADVRYDAAGTPYLADVAERFSTTQGIEAQDFTDEDNRVTVPRYLSAAATYSVDLYAGTWRPLRYVSGEYNEPEGLFPGGSATLLESSRDKGAGRGSSQYIDLWKLDLAAAAKGSASRGDASLTGYSGMSRLTRWGDIDGFKATNAVVSPDGRFVAFQTARRGLEVGAGEGIFLMALDAAPPSAVTLFRDDFDAPPDAPDPRRRAATPFAETPFGGGAATGPDGLPGYRAADPWSVARAGAASASTITAVPAPTRFADGAAVAFGTAAGGAGTTTLERTLDARGFRNLSLRLSALQPSGAFGAGDALRVDVDTGYGWVRLLTDAQVWNGVDDAGPDAPGAALPGRRATTPTALLALPASASDNPAVRVRVTMTTAAGGGAYALDRVEVAATPVG